MQLRTWASFRRVWEDRPEVRFINYPAFVPLLEARAGALAYQQPDVPGLWKMERFLSLVLGEIPRLRDDAEGYGPHGRGYIVHMDIPDEARDAYFRLRNRYAALARNLPTS